MTDLASNVLYYGDNLDILRRYLPDAAVDLVYLDPPFNSNRDDNVIFRDESGNATDAQLPAFEDTWPHGSASRVPRRGRLVDNSLALRFTTEYMEAPERRQQPEERPP
jgi:site-specific DNA-methyltransferase (adenine-specific)